MIDDFQVFVSDFQVYLFLIDKTWLSEIKLFEYSLTYIQVEFGGRANQLSKSEQFPIAGWRRNEQTQGRDRERKGQERSGSGKGEEEPRVDEEVRKFVYTVYTKAR